MKAEKEPECGKKKILSGCQIAKIKGEEDCPYGIFFSEMEKH